MKKHIIRILAVCMALMLWAASALAAAPATPNQKLALRTGPNTKYVELFTLPQSTDITAIEYEEGNGVTWVLVEFDYKGQPMRGYTGLKRMTVHGDIPWADHLNFRMDVFQDGTVYAAPYDSAAYCGSVECFQEVTLLRYDGNFAYIEFYDSAKGAPSRGWVYDWMVDAGTSSDTPVVSSGIHTGGVSVDMIAQFSTFLYAEPSNLSAALIQIPQGAYVQCYGNLFNGFSIVGYAGSVGYVPSAFLK